MKITGIIKEHFHTFSTCVLYGDKRLGKILGFDGGDCEKLRILGCYAVWLL
jgi:hypothetical protein